MFKRIAAVTLMFGAAVVATPAIGSAQEFRGDYHSGYDRDYRSGYDRDYGSGYDRDYGSVYDRDYRGHGHRDREFWERERAREIRERFERDGYREARRGFYDRFGRWHRY